MPFIYWLIDKQCLQKFKITVVQGLLLFNALLIVVFNKKFFFLSNIGYGIGFDVIICKFIIICCSFFFNRYLILVVISLLISIFIFVTFSVFISYTFFVVFRAFFFLFIIIIRTIIILSQALNIRFYTWNSFISINNAFNFNPFFYTTIPNSLLLLTFFFRKYLIFIGKIFTSFVYLGGQVISWCFQC